VKGKGPAKVLVVDDDPLVLRILRDKLVEAGFLVATTSSAFGALQVAEEQRPDLMIIDVMLPALPGQKIAAAAKERLGGSGLKVMLYSGKPAKELESLTREAGADGWALKTSDYEALLSQVKRLIGRE